MNGTLNALKSAKSEPFVKRVVITASFACIVEPKDPGTYVFTEKDWNEYSPKQVRGAAVLSRFLDAGKN